MLCRRDVSAARISLRKISIHCHSLPSIKNPFELKSSRITIIWWIYMKCMKSQCRQLSKDGRRWQKMACPCLLVARVISLTTTEFKRPDVSRLVCISRLGLNSRMGVWSVWLGFVPLVGRGWWPVRASAICEALPFAKSCATCASRSPVTPSWQRLEQLKQRSKLTKVALSIWY